MTERDLERVLTQSVQDVHLSDAARRSIRLATKEERPVKMKKFVAIALAVVLMLSASIAVAEELGLFDFLARKIGQTVLPGANELVQSDVAYGETDDVTFTVKQAVYDGKSASLLVEMISVTKKPLSALLRELTDQFGALYMAEYDWALTANSRVEIDRILMQKKLLPDFGMQIEKVSYRDGCKVYFKEGWIIARFSGTEPRVRIFAEMPSRERARGLVRTMAAFLGLEFHD